MLTPDQIAERERYEKASSERLEQPLDSGDWLHGPEAIEIPIREPYTWLHQEIEKSVTKGATVLDLCGGDGIHAMTAAWKGGEVTVADISEQSLQLAHLRAEAAGVSIETRAGDIHELEFEGTELFDVITCVGSFSYFHHEEVLRKVHQWMKEGGVFLMVDSLNHNPIYRWNRQRAYRRGARSLFTLEHMPNRNTISLIEEIFGRDNVSCHFFGICSFMVPVLRNMLSPGAVESFLAKSDALLKPLFKWGAFKVGVRVVKHSPEPEV